MKNYRSLLSASCGVLLLALISLSACDKIDAPYREQTAVGVTYLSDDAVVINGDTLEFPADNTTPEKHVLIEDYTGILCGNCPYAGLKLNDTLKPLFGDRLVAMAVHAGFFADPCPQGLACSGSQPAGALETDFRTAVGDAWDTKFGNSNAGNPNGLVDRIGYPTNQQVKFPNQWRGLIENRLLESTPFRLRIQTEFVDASREVKVAVQSENVAALNATYKLQVVITEDSLVDWQVWYPPRTPEYDPSFLHRHVLRSSLNSEFGEKIYEGTVAAGDKVLRGYSATLPAGQVAAHCYAIAFIYNADTYEVLQVAERALIE